MARLSFIVVALLLTIALSGCGASPIATPTPLSKLTLGTGELTPIITASDLSVGRNRFTLGILDEKNTPITDAKMHLRFFYLNESEQRPRAETDAIFLGEGIEQWGVYIAHANFDAAGHWGAEVVVKRDGKPDASLRRRFEVKAQSQTPPIGSPAPRSLNKTNRDKDSAKPWEINTFQGPDDMHDLTIAEAVAQKKPLVVLFATPQFCTSRLCGPQHERVQQVEMKFKDRVNFIHVEIFKDPNKGIVTDTVQEWRLPSDPWIFLVDRQGLVADKFEGGTTAQELEEALTKLLAV